MNTYVSHLESAIDGTTFPAGKMRLELIDNRRVLRHEDVYLHACSRPIGSQRAAGVARRRNGQAMQSEMLRHANGQRHAPAFETSRRQLRFVLDKQTA